MVVGYGKNVQSDCGNMGELRPSSYEDYPSRFGILLKVVVFLYVSIVL